jgi:subtilisin family serine protease
VVATRSKGHELVVVGLDDAGIDRLRQNGFEIVESHQIGLLGANAARVRAPRTMGRKTALRRASALLPGGSLVVANDVFAAAPFTPESDCLEGCESTTLVEWTPSFGSCATGTAIGMIDTGVDMGHPVLAEAQIVSRQFIAPDASQSSSAHGTAVASVLVGASRDRRIGLLDDVTIYAADAFHESSDGNRADTYSIVRALDWLASEPVKVVNMSLSGPDNALLQKAIRAVQDRNIVIVAAAGNERNTGAGYPARYEGVVAVSGVDHRLRKLRNANTGKHIDFAAPGADIITAQTAEQIGPVRGTSFAAPFVAAAFAVGLNRGGDYASVQALLTASAKDLGNPGHDTTFGWGLIRYTALATRCE